LDARSSKIKYTRELALLSEGWSNNLNFWTGGTQQGCQGQWSWCGMQPLLGLSNDLKWEPGQPDNNGGVEDCVHLRFVLNKTGTIISDRKCEDRYIYACEVKML
jgi:Lectin C-type domain